MKCTIQNTMLITQSQGSWVTTVRSDLPSSTLSSGLSAGVQLFIYVHVHATALKTKEQLKSCACCLLAAWRTGTKICSLSVPLPPHTCSERFEISLSICWYYFTNWGASSLNMCNIVLYNNCLSVHIPLVKLRLEMVDFMQPEGVVTLGGSSLTSWFLTCVCLAFYEAVCFALERSILE